MPKAASHCALPASEAMLVAAKERGSPMRSSGDCRGSAAHRLRCTGWWWYVGWRWAALQARVRPVGVNSGHYYFGDMTSAANCQQPAHLVGPQVHGQGDQPVDQEGELDRRRQAQRPLAGGQPLQRGGAVVEQHVGLQIEWWVVGWRGWGGREGRGGFADCTELVCWPGASCAAAQRHADWHPAQQALASAVGSWQPSHTARAETSPRLAALSQAGRATHLQVWPKHQAVGEANGQEDGDGERPGSRLQAGQAEQAGQAGQVQRERMCVMQESKKSA